MTQWEYVIIPFYGQTEGLNVAGFSGWEAVAVIADTVLMKRPIERTQAWERVGGTDKP